MKSIIKSINTLSPICLNRTEVSVYIIIISYLIASTFSFKVWTQSEMESGKSSDNLFDVKKSNASKGSLLFSVFLQGHFEVTILNFDLCQKFIFYFKGKTPTEINMYGPCMLLMRPYMYMGSAKIV